MRSCPKCGTRYADDLAYCPNDGTATTLVVEKGSIAPADPFIGTTIDGRYRIESRLGEGGMGVVYRASHVVLKKAIAIKVMRGEQAQDPEVVQRFVQEAQSSSAIGHPNIISISDFGTTGDGSVYFAMEHLEGQTLGKAMEQGQLDQKRALGLFTQIASALEAAHQRGIVHRDLKPDNVFLVQKNDQRDFVKVLDFGIAKVKNAAAKITRTGMVFGTPHYMSPEQAAGQAVDHRSDIYSLGVIMYQVFAGQLPFDAESYMGVITKHMYDEPVPPSRLMPRVDGSLERMIMIALEKKPEQRYQAMLELKEDLERVQRGEQVERASRQSLAASDTIAAFATASNLQAPPARETAVSSVAAGKSSLPAPSASSSMSSMSNAPSTRSSFSDDAPIELPVNKRPAWLVPVIVVALLGGGAATFLASRDEPAKAASDASPTPAPSPTPTPSQPSAATPPSPIAVPKTQVHINVEPASAELFLNEASIGHASAAVDRPVTGQLKLAVRASGYVTENVLIDSDSPDTISLQLEREAPKPTQHAESSAHKPKEPVEKPAEPAKKPKPVRSNGLSDVVDPWQ